MSSNDHVTADRTPETTEPTRGAVDLLAALQRAVDAAKEDRRKSAAEPSDCRFSSLREHKATECPVCNPNDWMDAEVTR